MAVIRDVTVMCDTCTAYGKEPWNVSMLSWTDWNPTRSDLREVMKSRGWKTKGPAWQKFYACPECVAKPQFKDVFNARYEQMQGGK